MKFRSTDSESPEILQLNDLPKDAEIHFEFDKEMLAVQDSQHFLDTFKPTAKSNKADIRKLFGRVVFSFASLGLDDEIWGNQEVRTCVSKLNEAWPCWLFYCVPDEAVLLPVLACLCSDLRSAYDSESGEITLELLSEQTIPIFLHWMLTAIELAESAGIPNKVMTHRFHEWMCMLLPPEVAEDYAQNVLPFE